MLICINLKSIIVILRILNEWMLYSWKNLKLNTGCDLVFLLIKLKFVNFGCVLNEIRDGKCV